MSALVDHEALGRRLYPECAAADGYFSSPCDYSPIIDECGEVLERRDDGDYQGDTFVVVTNRGRFGFVSISWGSCSGCDALQAAGSYADLGHLASGIVDAVHWEDTEADLLAWLQASVERNEHYARAWESVEDRDASTFGQLKLALAARVSR